MHDDGYPRTGSCANEGGGAGDVAGTILFGSISPAMSPQKMTGALDAGALEDPSCSFPPVAMMQDGDDRGSECGDGTIAGRSTEQEPKSDKHHCPLVLLQEVSSNSRPDRGGDETVAPAGGGESYSEETLGHRSVLRGSKDRRHFVVGGTAPSPQVASGVAAEAKVNSNSNLTQEVAAVSPSTQYAGRVTESAGIENSIRRDGVQPGMSIDESHEFSISSNSTSPKTSAVPYTRHPSVTPPLDAAEERSRRRYSGISKKRKCDKRPQLEGGGGSSRCDNNPAKVDTEWENEIAKNILSLYQTKLKADLDEKRGAREDELVVSLVMSRTRRGAGTLFRFWRNQAKYQSRES